MLSRDERALVEIGQRARDTSQRLHRARRQVALSHDARQQYAERRAQRHERVELLRAELHVATIALSSNLERVRVVDLRTQLLVTRAMARGHSCGGARR